MSPSPSRNRGVAETIHLIDQNFDEVASGVTSVVFGRRADSAFKATRMEAPSMRLAVLGSGGIGGILRGAPREGRTRRRVHCARGAPASAATARLTVRTPEGESTIPVTAVADTKSLAPVDLVPLVREIIRHEACGSGADAIDGPETRVVVTLQNGIDHIEAIASVVGSGAVLAGAVYIALQLASPGVVLRTGGEGRIVLGELSGATTERVQRIASAFEQSRIPHEVSTDINRVLWEKFLFIAGVRWRDGARALGHWSAPREPESRRLLTTACEEIAAIALREGVATSGDAVDRVIRQAAALPPQWRSSMARDLADGRPLEVDALSGAVVRRGLKLGIPTPIHRTIAACLSFHQPSGSARPHAANSVVQV